MYAIVRVGVELLTNHRKINLSLRFASLLIINNKLCTIYESCSLFQWRSHGSAVLFPGPPNVKC